MWKTISLKPCGCEIIQHQEHKRILPLPCDLCKAKYENAIPGCPDHGVTGMVCIRCQAARAGATMSERRLKALRRNFKIARLKRWGKPIPPSLRKKETA